MTQLATPQRPLSGQRTADTQLLNNSPLLAVLRHEIALAQPLGLTDFKLGTEEEGLGPEEVRFLASLTGHGVGAMVKIGGPCARADLRLAGEVGASAVIAPMVESVFALTRFVEAADLELPSAAIGRAFNLETGQAIAQLDGLLQSPAAKSLAFVNIGRSDLTASLGWQVDEPRSHDMVAQTVLRLHQAGFAAHVGGKVTRATLLPLLARVTFAVFHTRFLVFTVTPQVEAAITQALRVEVALLDVLAAAFPERAQAHQARAEETGRRMQG